MCHSLSRWHPFLYNLVKMPLKHKLLQTAPYGNRSNWLCTIVFYRRRTSLAAFAQLVKSEGKYTSLIFLFVTSNSLIIATFFPFSRFRLFWLCKCQAFSKNYILHDICMGPSVLASVGNHLYYLYCRNTSEFMSETKSHSVMCWTTAVKMSLPWRFLT